MLGAVDLALPFALGLLCVAGWLTRRRGAPSRSTVAALLVSALALALRLALGPWETFHGNGQGPMWIASVLGRGWANSGYGEGYAHWYRPVAVLAGPHVERAVFAENAVLGAASAGVVLSLAEALGAPLAGAVLAGLAVAIDPYAIRASTSETYLVPIFFGVHLAALAALRSGGDLRARRLLPGAARVVACALLVDRTVAVHPAGWPLAALVPAFVLARADDPADAPTWLARRALDTRHAALVASSALAALAGLSFDSLLDVWNAARSSSIISGRLIHFDRLRPALLLPLLTSRPRTLAALPLAVGGVLTPLLWARAYAALPEFELAFVRMCAPAVLLPVLVALPRALTRRAALPAAGAIGLALFLHHRWPDLARPSTEQLENQLVREALRAHPGCQLAHVDRAGQRLLALPTYEGHRVGDPPVPPGGARCTLYWRGSICAGTGVGPACEAAERELTLSPLGRWELPARASMRGLGYATDPVVVELFRAD